MEDEKRLRLSFFGVLGVLMLISLCCISLFVLLFNLGFPSFFAELSDPAQKPLCTSDGGKNICPVGHEANTVQIVLESPFSLRIKGPSQAFFTDGKQLIQLTNLLDSRCPTDVNCVWEGQAAADFMIFDEKGITKPFTLVLGGAKLKEQYFKWGKYYLVWLSLEPRLGSKDEAGSAKQILNLLLTEDINNLPK
ncbi:MAG: hypothetical protein VB108_04295 [Anaerolineaceae bacterium]|nr:hypothetical protein [Anaerolineaceae bacterium]